MSEICAVITPAWGAVAPRQVEEFELIARAQEGNRQAFDELIQRYDRAVLRLALRLSGSEADAQDIYQEAFFKAYRNITSFRRQSSFYTWLHRIVCNVCFDHLRIRRSRREDAHVATASDGTEHDLLDDVPDHRIGSDPERALAQRELRRHFHFALRKLTPRERMVFELKHFEDLKLRQVGRILNTSEDTAKNTLFRATHKLRTYLSHVRRGK
jgi:RNA polymerase sigma-70 factor (ECF subfamily)